MLDVTKVKKIVIKIGSSLLIKDGDVRNEWLDGLVKDVSELGKLGIDVAIVSSGAIALGKAYIERSLERSFSIETLAEKQALAAIGQINLMSEYKNSFGKKKLITAQLLLTRDDCVLKKRHLNVTNTISTLMQYGFVPIINENDTVSVSEIKIGDNDQLAAIVARMIDADYLILLSDIDGLYDKNPQTNKDAKLIPIINNIDKNIEDMASGPTSKVGTGGMVTKIKAAKIAKEANCQTIITSGLSDKPNILELIFGTKPHSLFR